MEIFQSLHDLHSLEIRKDHQVLRQMVVLERSQNHCRQVVSSNEKGGEKTNRKN